ncbi:septal ring lytic transglycosylase RlpA family protein [Jiella sp. MQZ9-1]|uniref:Endolytic peptidoglycan transglycosylase RlpA n=1 Tax=Jiella flava TaxID=2816857 RepID=A0A939JTK8_9HYPH|nr:septal ring lytic transglycosylase RlpA family protein [Jiella flava]MBO0662240.1 septal ring lytic transglycosylase RlpA family protein [Jiella flava]MCD2470929.1 septal ring lytic transglycosylase RlpA family protein [Jiella flava]
MNIAKTIALAVALLSAPALTQAPIAHFEAQAGTTAAKSGRASYYGTRFHGRRTANGERFNMNAMTAAHKTLPFGTKVRVTNRRNGKSVVVRINDRGPYARGRVIDLSKAAASRIGMINSGTAPVKIDVL